MSRSLIKMVHLALKPVNKSLEFPARHKARDGKSSRWSFPPHIITVEINFTSIPLVVGFFPQISEARLTICYQSKKSN